MKRFRSSDDIDSCKDKGSNPSRSSRSFYYKSDNVRKGLISSSPSSRYDRDRSADDDGRELSRMVRKRSDHSFEGFDRRKGLGFGFDRYSSREGFTGGGTERSAHSSDSFCGSRREFPKGFRSERDRSRREGSVSSWRKFGNGSKDFEEGNRGSRVGNEERMSGSRSSPKGLRDYVKSPTWSRDSGSEQTRAVRGGWRDEGKAKSSNSKSKSSPTHSKDSGSEQSKSVEVGKKGEVEVKGVEIEAKSVESGSSSEMEEGELEPEPASVPQAAKQEVVEEDVNVREKTVEENGELNLHQTANESDTQHNNQVNDEENEPHRESVSVGKDVAKEVDGTPNCGENLNCNTSINDHEVGNVGSEDGDQEAERLKEKTQGKEEGSEDMFAEQPLYVERGIRKERVIDLDVKVGVIEVQESSKDVKKEFAGAEVNADMETENLGQSLKDKGKGVAVSPVHDTDSAQNGLWLEKESRDIGSCTDKDDDMEGRSTRAFELFSSSPVLKGEKVEQSSDGKQKDEKLVIEPLDLSLSLPNVLLPISATRDTTQAPGSPSQGRSVQSFSTFCNSDGFTASMSLSGSQSFFHNPSCSLTQNSIDMDNYEQSVHSRPIFQAVDQGGWQGQAQNDSKLKDIPLYQRIVANGNGSLHQPRGLHSTSNSQALQGSSKMSNGFERQLSFYKQLSGGQTRNPDDTRSPSQSVGSHDVGSNYGIEKKQAMRDKHGSSLYRSNSQRDQEQFMIGGPDFVETITSRIVSDPIHVMARKFDEMTAQIASCLKESILEIMLKADRQGQLYALQSVLNNRSDLTLDMLLKSHRTQLEILVALKTGLSEYLQIDNSILSSDLAEVFLNLRCRNLACRSPLPVDECDCEVCVKKNGFCSACMCLVCSKFDMASNTCSWIGCDICLHWCHADCALRESYIRNGRSAIGAQGNTEMQFHCVACDHPSEMFGFVKEVFLNSAKEWTVETFCKELQYVKRIFSASKDVRGRLLHELADQMLTKLATKSNLHEVYSHIMGFLTESDTSKFGNTYILSGKEQGKGTEGEAAGPSQDSLWRKSICTDKAPQLEISASLLPSLHSNLNEKHATDTRLQMSAQDEPLFDELESVVRIKQAEAKMFQTRADDARRNAEGLKQIAIAKNEKIEEEYTRRIAKLRLIEAEEMRKQKYEEFQALERSHFKYFGMKTRMEADIKDLLLKVEATKRSLAM
uniref:Protein OBERON 4 n=1 Tax=Rhizophora mucronata TaxID=61149 RepID=A0A2P2NYV5_RHIMU